MELKLTKAIKINGKNVKKLKYDFEKITPELFIDADFMAHRKASERGGAVLQVMELDTSLHLYMGFAAIIAEDIDIDWMDLETMSGVDLIEVARIGRNFTKGSLDAEEETDSEEKTSGEQ